MSNAKPCESFRDARAGAPGSQVFCDVHIEDPGCHHCGAPRSAHGPDLEACGKAAYEGFYRYSLDMRRRWAELPAHEQDDWRAAARSALAIASASR